MSSQRYPIPAAICRCETEVKYSRFIATINRCDSADEALTFIAAIKQEFPDANHNCWAYMVGPPGSTDRTGLSDDGEPHGVAGKPLLMTLQHSKVGDLVVVVSRYFGGIKLGKGGMVKAYTLALQNALKELQTAEKIDWRQLRITLAYTLLSSVENLLPDYEAESLSSDYADQVKLDVRAPAERLEDLKTRLTNLSAGQIRFS